jgi:hypothetical protein
MSNFWGAVHVGDFVLVLGVFPGYFAARVIMSWKWLRIEQK